MDSVSRTSSCTCELEGAICSGGLFGKKHTYALLDERAPKPSGFDRDEAMMELTRRYLLAHGPATVKDLRWWSSMTVADIRAALDRLGAELRSAIVDGMRFWWMGTDERPPAPRTVRLLQTYDELLVGYTESRFFGDPRANAARAAWRDRSLPGGIVLVDGLVAGHWRRRLDGEKVVVELRMYEAVAGGARP